jgi:hypothetical protein
MILFYRERMEAGIHGLKVLNSLDIKLIKYIFGHERK